jgi:non-structural maintenance of chromosomes element 4
MASWKQLIDVFGIKEPMIRHREEDEHLNVGAKGWYA